MHFVFAGAIFFLLFFFAVERLLILNAFLARPQYSNRVGCATETAGMINVYRFCRLKIYIYTYMYKNASETKQRQALEHRLAHFEPSATCQLSFLGSKSRSRSSPLLSKHFLFGEFRKSIELKIAGFVLLRVPQEAPPSACVNLVEGPLRFMNESDNV